MNNYDTTRVSLLLRLRNHSDKLGWNEFHDRYGELLYRYARGRGASAVDAEDIVQEVEMSLFKAMDGFEYDVTKGRFRNYLRAVVVRTMGRRASREARYGESLDPGTFDYIEAARDAEGDERWEREWQLHRLRWALRRVAPDIEPITLKAFRLYVLQGMSAAETASKLSIQVDSVYQAKTRVLRRVKEALDSIDPDGEI